MISSIKKIFFVCWLITGTITYSYSQVAVENETLEVHMTKGRKQAKFNVRSRHGAGKGSFEIFTVIELKRLKNKDDIIDLNKFSLIDHSNKLRYRGSDISIGHPLGYKEGSILMMEKVANTSIYGSYNPEIRDTFSDYTIDGYQDIQRKTQFGLRKKDVTQTYFHPVGKGVKRVRLIFYIPNQLKEKEYQLYYAQTKVGTITLKSK